jgi:hypothetical protein
MAPPGALAETVKFRQGVDGYAGAKDVELRGGQALPGTTPKKKAEAKKDEAGSAKKKDAAGKKKAAASKHEAAAPKASDPSISVDRDNHGVQSMALIRFDDIVGKGPGRVPRGSTVTSAILTVRGNDAGGGKVYVHRMLADWDASSVTWETAKLGGNSEGGIQADDKEATAPITSFATDRTGTFDIDVTATVKAWVAGTAPNHGLALTCDSTDGWDFDSSEADAVDHRPLLTITFTPPAAR